MDGYLLPGFPANICLLDTLHIARQMLDGESGGPWARYWVWVFALDTSPITNSS
jgi:hypothetical protein